MWGGTRKLPTCPSIFGFRTLRDGRPRLLLQEAVYTAVLRWHARLFVGCHGVRRIHHAQRFEDALLVVGFERRAGDFLDDHAEHARAGAVVPFVAMIAQQRQLPLALFRRLREPVLDRVRKLVAMPEVCVWPELSLSGCGIGAIHPSLPG
jgi:hypothetical protein